MGLTLAVVGIWLGAAVVLGALWALVGLGLHRVRCPHDQVHGPPQAPAHRGADSSAEAAATDARSQVSDSPRHVA